MSGIPGRAPPCVDPVQGQEGQGKISGSRTKVTIDGKKAKRKAIKKGMICTPGPGEEAKNVDCKT